MTMYIRNVSGRTYWVPREVKKPKIDVEALPQEARGAVAAMMEAVHGQMAHDEEVAIAPEHEKDIEDWLRSVNHPQEKPRFAMRRA